MQGLRQRTMTANIMRHRLRAATNTAVSSQTIRRPLHAANIRTRCPNKKSKLTAGHQDFFLELLNELKQMNVLTETLQPESNNEFFEVTLNVAEGIEAADGTAQFKSHVKTFSKRKGYVASFMSKADEIAHYGTGFHFNHSLWTFDGANVLFDSSKEDQLSDVARHWIAGLVKHGPGLTALCMPTVNCYRRIGKERLPTRSDWSVLDRNATFVVRKTRKNNIYVEDRLPSSAGNPYLVMAATVAAGIDGIRNKIPLQNKTEDFCVLPPDLETALTCLQEDAVLVGALGKDLVELFVATKTMEIHHLKSMGQTSGTDSFQNEYHLYFQNA
ncbi:glutamine synthetase-like [Aplysia californica]|uniref:Lengsin n=1 Tax=Aplysia californica TaxID=6500 RepID=A0ABM0JV88_APLCA|nr:glutamine synthetase-like [Aplysia californica]